MSKKYKPKKPDVLDAVMSNLLPKMVEVDEVLALLKTEEGFELAKKIHEQGKKQ